MADTQEKIGKAIRIISAIIGIVQTIFGIKKNCTKNKPDGQEPKLP